MTPSYVHRAPKVSYFSCFSFKMWSKIAKGSRGIKNNKNISEGSYLYIKTLYKFKGSLKKTQN